MRGGEGVAEGHSRASEPLLLGVCSSRSILRQDIIQISSSSFTLQHTRASTEAASFKSSKATRSRTRDLGNAFAYPFGNLCSNSHNVIFGRSLLVSPVHRSATTTALLPIITETDELSTSRMLRSTSISTLGTESQREY